MFTNKGRNEKDTNPAWDQDHDDKTQYKISQASRTLSLQWAVNGG